MGRGRSTLGALGAALALCCMLVGAALPAPAATTAQRLAAVEKALAGLEDTAARYRALEAELTLHLSAARQQEKQVLAELQSAVRALTEMGGETDLAAAESLVQEVGKLTAGLEYALGAWDRRLASARAAQDEACARSARLAEVPAPRPGQVSAWAEDSARGLRAEAEKVRAGRRKLTAAWEALSPAAQRLSAQLDSLRSLLENQDQYRARFRSLGGLDAQLRSVEKDLARARRLREEMAALPRPSPSSLQALERELLELSRSGDAAPGSELGARVDAALGRLPLVALPLEPPPVGGLDRRARQLREQAGRLDPARLEASMQRAEAVAARAPELDRKSVV